MATTSSVATPATSQRTRPPRPPRPPLLLRESIGRLSTAETCASPDGSAPCANRDALCAWPDAAGELSLTLGNEGCCRSTRVCSSSPPWPVTVIEKEPLVRSSSHHRDALS